MTLVLISEMEDAAKWRAELASKAPDIAFEVWPDVENYEDVSMIAIDYNNIRAERFGLFPKLKCIAFLGHGAGDLLDCAALPPGIQIMRLKDPGLIRTMVEYVVLYLLRDLRFEPLYVQQQQDRIWRQHQPRFANEVAVGVMGLGSVGEAVACKLRDFEFKVSGWARSQHQIKDVACFSGEDTLKRFLSPLDYLVCVLPLTRETRRIINADTISSMKKGVYLINIGRGALIDEDDLLAALNNGQVSGATLDVFCVEPLPQVSAFWRHPEVMVTPHEAGARVEGSIPDIIENYRRLMAGEALINLADPIRGY